MRPAGGGQGVWSLPPRERDIHVWIIWMDGAAPHPVHRPDYFRRGEAASIGRRGRQGDQGIQAIRQ